MGLAEGTLNDKEATKGFGSPNYRLVPKTNVAVTRPALEQAGWRCRRCSDDSDLRVVELRISGELRVLCNVCRVHSGW